MRFQILLNENHLGRARDYTAKLNDKEAGMAEMSAKFAEVSKELYVCKSGDRSP